MERVGRVCPGLLAAGTEFAAAIGEWTTAASASRATQVSSSSWSATVKVT